MRSFRVGWTDGRCRGDGGTPAAADAAGEAHPARGRPARGVVQGAGGADRSRSASDRRARATVPPAEAAARRAAETAVAALGDANHLGGDRGHGSIRRVSVARAGGLDGSRPGAVLDPDTSTRSGVRGELVHRGEADAASSQRRGPAPPLQRAEPRARPMPAQVARGRATRARVRRPVEPAVVACKRRTRQLLRSIGPVRANPRTRLAHLVHKVRRLVRIEPRRAPARPLMQVATPRPAGPERSRSTSRHRSPRSRRSPAPRQRHDAGRGAAAGCARCSPDGALQGGSTVATSRAMAGPARTGAAVPTPPDRRRASDRAADSVAPEGAARRPSPRVGRAPPISRGGSRRELRPSRGVPARDARHGVDHGRGSG